MDFAKLFNTEKGQILVMLDTDDDGDPAIKFFANPPSFGVCSVSMSFEDSDTGNDHAEEAFDRVDEKLALEVTAELFKFALPE